MVVWIFILTSICCRWKTIFSTIISINSLMIYLIF